MAIPLQQLLNPEISAPADTATLAITGLTADSRTVKPGFLFAALSGTKADGRAFLHDAIAKGAAALLVGPNAAIPDNTTIPILRAAEPRRALALMAAAFYGPGPDTIVAITGTSGKTSVAEFTRQIFAHLGHQAASLGTIGVVKPSGAVYGSLTTPDPVTLARTLAELRAEGVTHLAMEASSHGLDQFRLDGVNLTAGAFTNLGRDHLDYHPTIEHYLAAKMRLFTTLLKPGQHAIINTDGAYSAQAVTAAYANRLVPISVGTTGWNIELVSVLRERFMQRLTLRHRPTQRHDSETHELLLPLAGAYQVENALTAAGLALAIGAPFPAIAQALSQLKGVPGRLDRVGEARGGLAIVDYAHKPEALSAALDAVRPFATGKLICVFGCGGDRDRGKRPIMGAIASAKADVVIVTDDNPRTEQASAIRAEVLAGAPTAIEIGDRAEAINAAVAMMGAGDVVLVAGKGHETGQIVGTTVLPFSDHAVLAAALTEHAA